MSGTATLAQALVAAQADMPALQRDKINPAFKSKYLSLEALLAEVLPVLNRHGLALIQMPDYLRSDLNDSLIPAMTTRIVHGESGQEIETTMLLLASKSDPQGQGSAITYARRYMLMSMLGLSADEDDDGNAASSGRRSADARTSTPATISDAQRKRLRAIQQERGVSDATLKQMVKTIAGVDSSTLIPRAKYDELVAAVEAEKVSA